MQKGHSPIFILFIFFSLFLGCSLKNYTLFQGKSEQTGKIVYEYKISPNDRISVTVFRHPELSTKRGSNFPDERGEGVLVSKDGTVVLPLIGKVKLHGLTVEEAQNLLTQKYKVYLKHPEVYVEIVNKRVYVIGEVKKPGVVPIYNRQITLIEALARAGDINLYGKRNEILIIRGDLNNPDIIKVDLTKLKNLRKTTMLLLPNDIVYVPPNRMRKFNIGINETTPLLELISNILNPFVQIKYLSQ